MTGRLNLLSETGMVKRTSVGLILITALALILAGLMCGCPSDQPAETGGGSSSVSSAGKPQTSNAEDAGAAKLPVPLSQRPYRQVHASVEQAWFLVETGYQVVKDKYIQANTLLASTSAEDKAEGARLKNAVTAEIQTTIFNVNPTIDKLFKEAIAAEPDNALNYAAYAYYLKARKIVDESGTYVGEGETEALANIDKAIELWPDDSGFYLLKIHILSAPHQCHEWFRGAAGEDLVLASRLEQLRELFQLAEKYDPKNSFINYYHAILVTSLTPPDLRGDIRDEVLREIIAGNQKEQGNFYFPPPLPPYAAIANPIAIPEDGLEAIYYDHWNFFGMIAEDNMRNLIDLLMQGLTWPADRDTYKEIMLAIYKVGAVKPPSRSFFSLQFGVINGLQLAAAPGSPEALEFASVARFLNQQYFELANEELKRKVLTDSTQLDVEGVQTAERRTVRLDPDVQKFQKRQAAYLKKAGEILKLDFNLPDDPEKW